MFCEKCGQNIPDDSAFCPNCGAPIAVPEPEPVAQEVPVVETLEEVKPEEIQPEPQPVQPEPQPVQPEPQPEPIPLIEPVPQPQPQPQQFQQSQFQQPQPQPQQFQQPQFQQAQQFQQPQFQQQPQAIPVYQQPQYNPYAQQPAYQQPQFQPQDNSRQDAFNAGYEKGYREAAAKVKPAVPPEYQPMSPWGFFGWEIVYSIPIVGFIFLIINSIKKTNLSRRNWTLHFWIPAMIAAVVGVIVLIVALITGASIGEWFKNIGK